MGHYWSFPATYIWLLVILFSSNHNIHKSLCGFCFWASDLLINRFYKNLSIKSLKPKNKGHSNFYECCDLTKKVYLVIMIWWFLSKISIQFLLPISRVFDFVSRNWKNVKSSYGIYPRFIARYRVSFQIRFWSTFGRLAAFLLPK